MLAVVLALGASAAWGSADFIAGVGCRRVTLLTVLLVSQAASGIPNDTQSFKLQGSALAPSAIAPQFAAPPASPAELSPADQFHLFLRQAERSRAYPVPPRQPRAAIQASLQGPILPSDSGKNRTFKVCGNLTCGSDSLRTVRATLMKL